MLHIPLKTINQPCISGSFEMNEKNRKKNTSPPWLTWWWSSLRATFAHMITIITIFSFLKRNNTLVCGYTKAKKLYYNKLRDLHICTEKNWTFSRGGVFLFLFLYINTKAIDRNIKAKYYFATKTSTHTKFCVYKIYTESFMYQFLVSEL